MRLSRLILDHGTTYAKALVDFGLTAAGLTQLRDALDQFKTEQVVLRAAHSEGAADTKELALYYREARALLVTQIDRQVNRYETKAPEFFAAYQSARKPNATATRSCKAGEGKV